jgi:hypothetical protein
MNKTFYSTLLLVLVSGSCMTSDVAALSCFDTILSYVMPTAWVEKRAAKQFQKDYFKERNTNVKLEIKKVKKQDRLDNSLRLANAICARDGVFYITKKSDETSMGSERIINGNMLLSFDVKKRRDKKDSGWNGILAKLVPSRMYQEVDDNKRKITDTLVVIDKNPTVFQEVNYFNGLCGLYIGNTAMVARLIETRNDSKSNELRHWRAASDNVAEHLRKLEKFNDEGLQADRPVYQTPEAIVKENDFYQKLMEKFPGVVKDNH